MTILPIPSIIERPLPYFLFYSVALLLVSLWPFNFLQSNMVTWEPEGGLAFAPPATAFTVAPPFKLCSLRSWTLLADVEAQPPLRSGRILGYGISERSPNVTIDQFYDDLVVRVRTSATQRTRELAVEKLFPADTNKRIVLAVVCTDSELSVFVNGERRSRQRLSGFDNDAWDPSAPLILGSHADGKFGWKGIYRRLGVYGSALSPADLKRSAGGFDRRGAVLRYTFEENGGTMAFDRGNGPTASLIWLPTFSPYRPTVLQSLRDYWPDFRRPFIRDILANIIMYVPLGFLIAAMLAARNSPLVTMTVPIGSALLISFVLEICQSYLPSRNSSLMDVTMNGAGAALGVLAYRKEWLQRLLAAFSLTFRNPTPSTHSRE